MANFFRYMPIAGARPAEPRRSGGFTLIEIIVVVSIVTVAFVSIIGLVQRAIVLYYNNKNVLIANNLAQEGIELVRYVRDDNWLIPPTYQAPNHYFASNISVDESSAPFNQRLNTNTYIFGIDTRILQDRSKIESFYKKDLNNNTTNQYGCTGVIKVCLKRAEAKLYRDDTIGTNIINRYSPTGPTTGLSSTGFSRLIFTEYRDGGQAATTTDDYLHVESWVYWQDHGADRFFHLDTDLYDYDWRN